MGTSHAIDKVLISVVEIMGSGSAPCAHKPGDEWVVTDFRAPEGMCTWALNSMAPFLATLRFGGTFPWAGDGSRTRVSCPDADNPVVFELRRLES